jgi:hypothetical protein
MIRDAAVRMTVPPAAIPVPPAPAPAAVPTLGKKQQRCAANKRVKAILQKRWPRLFTWAVPLAIGIREQILDALGDEVDRESLHAYLRW